MPLVPSSGLCNSTAPWFPHVWALARVEESKSFPRMSTVFGLGILQCKPIILQAFEVSNVCEFDRAFTSRCCFSSCSLEVMSPRRLLGGVPGLWRERKKCSQIKSMANPRAGQQSCGTPLPFEVKTRKRVDVKFGLRKLFLPAKPSSVLVLWTFQPWMAGATRRGTCRGKDRREPQMVTASRNEPASWLIGLILLSHSKSGSI